MPAKRLGSSIGASFLKLPLLLIALVACLLVATAPVRADSTPPSVVTIHLPAGVPVPPAMVTDVRCHIMPLAMPVDASPPSARPDCDLPGVVSPAGVLSGPCVSNNCQAMNYHGGPTVTQTQQRFIFLNCPNQCFSDWGNPLGFLSDLFSSNFVHVADQYMQPGVIKTGGRYQTSGNGAAVSATLNHTIYDSDVQSLIMVALNQVFNPTGGGGGYTQMYSFFLPPGQNLCQGSSSSPSTSCYCPDSNCNGGQFKFCAYHGSFNAVDATGATVHVIYQAIPYLNVGGCAITNGPNGGLVDSTNNVFSHEIFETITDPDLNAWWRASDGSEIGDICNFIEQNPIYLHTDAYSIQQEYSNAKVNCVGAYTTLALSHDVNFDMNSDVIWRDVNAGTVAIWEMNGTQIRNSTNAGVGAVGGGWSIVGSCDFNGDGKADILWRDSNSGTVAIWEMNGTQILNPSTSAVAAVANNWYIVGTGDFNGDGFCDIVWRNISNGAVAIWEMNGTQILNPNSASVGAVSLNWSIVATGDFNGDGKRDIVWRDSNSGAVVIWEMNGTQILNPNNSSVATVTTNWSIVGTGDFNGDGMSDLLWRDTSGNLAIWEMNGTQILNPSTSSLGGVGTNWSIVLTGDFNGDGNSDIAWRDTSGNVAIWEMNGTQILNASTSILGGVGTNWVIQGLNED